MTSKSKRSYLLLAATEYVRNRGASHNSLRDIASAIGTSHRMLIYHFGSREGLLIEVVRCFEQEQRAGLTRLLSDEARPILHRLRDLWTGFVFPQASPREALFFEMYGYALQGREDTKEFLREVVEAWLSPLTKVADELGVECEQQRISASLLLAVTRGILMSLLATGSVEDAEKTMDHFIENYFPFIEASRSEFR